MGVTKFTLRHIMKLAIFALAAAAAVALPSKDYASMFNAIHPGFWAEVDPNGGITLSRTISSATGIEGTAMVDSGCSGKDDYGSNDCSWSWGQKLGLTLNTTIAKDVTSGTIALDAKVDGFLPFKASCALCGTPCTIPIPVVKKTVTIKMPDCPIKGQGYSTTLSVTLPTKDPIPVKTSIAGTATVTSGDGSMSVTGSFSASLSS